MLLTTLTKKCKHKILIRLVNDQSYCLNSGVVCDEVNGEGEQYRGAVVILTSNSAMDLISSSQLIRVSLLLAEALDVHQNTHHLCSYIVYNYTTHI